MPFLQATLLKLGLVRAAAGIVERAGAGALAAGLLSPGTPRHLRHQRDSTSLFFLVAGFPFNDYWGFIAAPIWAIACG